VPWLNVCHRHIKPQSTVDRVLGFSPVFRIGTPHPLTHGRVYPSPFDPGGGERGHTCLRERGWGSQFTSGQTLKYFRYICTLWMELKLTLQDDRKTLSSACSHAFLFVQPLWRPLPTPPRPEPSSASRRCTTAAWTQRRLRRPASAPS
jgi:hypothetical protein